MKKLMTAGKSLLYSGAIIMGFLFIAGSFIETILIGYSDITATIWNALSFSGLLLIFIISCIMTISGLIMVLLAAFTKKPTDKNKESEI